MYCSPRAMFFYVSFKRGDCRNWWDWSTPTHSSTASTTILPPSQSLRFSTTLDSHVVLLPEGVAPVLRAFVCDWSSASRCGCTGAVHTHASNVTEIDGPLHWVWYIDCVTRVSIFFNCSVCFILSRDNGKLLLLYCYTSFSVAGFCFDILLNAGLICFVFVLWNVAYLSLVDVRMQWFQKVRGWILLCVCTCVCINWDSSIVRIANCNVFWGRHSSFCKFYLNIRLPSLTTLPLPGMSTLP